jgi:hypothetical protein
MEFNLVSLYGLLNEMWKINGVKERVGTVKAEKSWLPQTPYGVGSSAASVLQADWLATEFRIKATDKPSAGTSPVECVTAKLTCLVGMKPLTSAAET